MNIRDDLKELNYDFLANNRNGVPVLGSNFIYNLGSIPVLISAPHAVKQIRNNLSKPSDYLTGALALYLSKKIGCSYFVRTFNMADDPNYPIGITLNKIESLYLRSLKDFITKYRHFLVIDLHGCSNKRLYHASVWTNNFLFCPQNIVDIFQESFNANCFSFDPYGCEFEGGQVTRQCAQITNAMQLELVRYLRNLEDEGTLNKLIETLYRSLSETYEYSLKLERINN